MWVWGHAEHRKLDINEWTGKEWANDVADLYAEWAWWTHPCTHCSIIAISLLHYNSLQIQARNGSILGKITRHLADDINTRRGLQQLQKILQLGNATFGLIDWTSFGPATNKFTKTVYNRAYLCKHMGNHWFTEARAHKFDPLASDWWCCNKGMAETTEHIYQCSSWEPVDSKYFTKFVDLMQEKKMQNDILELFEAGLDIAFFMPFQFSDDEEFMAAADIMADEQVTKILICEEIQEDRQEAFLQQTKLGWTQLLMGYLTSGWQTCTAGLEHIWTTSCAHLFLEWGHTCGTHRNNTLYGPFKKRHQQQHCRLQAEAQVWLEAPSTESLVPLQKDACPRRDVMRARMETIATWQLQQQTMRWLIRNGKRTSIIMQFQTKASLEVWDRNCHGKLLAEEYRNY